MHVHCSFLALSIVGLFFLFGHTSLAQEAPSGFMPIHAAEFLSHRYDTLLSEQPSPLRETRLAAPAEDRVLRRRVFGYYPYWASANYYENIDYTAISHLGYFSADIDSTGAVSLMNASRLPLIATYANERKVKTILVATCFGYEKNDKLLGNAATAQKAIAGLMQILRSNPLQGVNVDIELLRQSQRQNLVRFIQWLRDSLSAYKPDMELSMAMPAVDWSNAFDIPTLASVCNYLILMGYDYYYSGSETAGPVAPLEGENYNVSRSVQTYLQALAQKSLPSSQLMLGVPWYGYEWATVDTSRKSKRDAVRGVGKSYTYSSAARRSQHVRRYDAATHSMRYNLRDSTGYLQGWYDDSTTLAEKYALVNNRDLGGVAVWALSYEGTDGLMWKAIKDAFLSLPTTVETSSLHTTPLLFPQPAQEILNVELLQPGQVSLYDNMGRMVVDTQTQSNHLSIDCRHIASGWYWLRTGQHSVPVLIHH